MSTRFQGLFHPPLGVLFTFPSRYWFTIGRSRCLALEGGPPRFPQGFSCLVVLRIPVPRPALLTTGFSPSLTVPSNTFVFAPGLASLVLQPQSLPCGSGWFGLFPLRSPLLRESHLISFRRATEMFQFTRCPPVGYVFPHRSPDITLEGLPHSESQGSSLVCSSP